jgi:hypothetical protein
MQSPDDRLTFMIITPVKCACIARDEPSLHPSSINGAGQVVLNPIVELTRSGGKLSIKENIVTQPNNA